MNRKLLLTVKRYAQKASGWLAFGIVLVLLAVWRMNSSEQIHKDLKELVSGNFHTQSQAMSDLTRIGPKCIPMLVGAMRSPDAAHRRRIVILLGSVGATADDPTQAIRALIDAMHDPDAAVRHQAALALGDFGARGGEGVPALNRALADPDREVKEGAAASLSRIGPPGAAAMPALLEMLRGEDLELAGYAADALGSIHCDAARVVPALAAVLRQHANHPFPPLESQREGARLFMLENVADALGQFGPEARPAVPELQVATGEDNQGVREHAAAAIGRINAAQTTTER